MDCENCSVVKETLDEDYCYVCIITEMIVKNVQAQKEDTDGQDN
jgi:hypothetical protein